MSTMADVPLLVISPYTSSERRINPSWTISQLKAKMEPVTGIPPLFQQLSYIPINSQNSTSLEVADQENTTLSTLLQLEKGAELKIADTRPPGTVENYTDVSAVEKYEMPIEQYEALPSTVLSWKKQKQLGRFDPDLSRREREKLDAQYLEVANAGIEIGKRCRVGGVEGDRRGVVKFVGEVDELGGGGVWVGVEYDEPVGKNDGTVRGKRIFECKGNNFGGFVRAARVEVGDFPERLLEDEEEI